MPRSRQFTRRTGLTIVAGFPAAIVVALKASVALAACQLPNGTTPGLCTYSGSGPALQITDPANSTTTATPSTFKGIATGTSGHGVTGEATGKNGVGGFFQAAAPSTSTTSTTALEAVNSGGGTTAKGKYGNAGVFTITNGDNSSDALSATTNGPGAGGLFSIATTKGADNSTADYHVPKPGEADTPAIWAQNDNSGGGGYYGQAGYFTITNINNYSDAVYAATYSGFGVAVHGYIGPAAPTNNNAADEGAGVWGQDLMEYGAIAVAGLSASGYSASFTGGKGGVGYCSYDGGATWSCTAPATAMKDRAKPKLGELLDRLDAMPVNYYRLEGAKAAERYLGPSAEDFHAAFGLGKDDKSIRDGNAQGVALAAAQGLYRKLKADEATIATQGAEIAVLKRENARIAALNAKLATLEGQVAARQGVADRLARLEAAMARLSPATNTRQAMLAK